MTAGPGRKPGGRAWLPVALVPAALLWGLLLWRAVSPPVPVAVSIEAPRDLVFCSAGILRRLAPPYDAVPVGPFYIQRLEVTEGDYEAFLKSNPDHPPPPHWPDRHGEPGDVNLPMVWVSLEDARAYAAFHGMRIPTSDEWEWAAIGEGRHHFWSRMASTGRANTADLRLFRRTPAGIIAEGLSAFGCLDLIGNVREWTDTRAPGFDERYFLRGGSYAEPLSIRDSRTLMDTHALVSFEEMVVDIDPATGELRELAVPRRESRPIPEFLAGPRTRSAQWGFRCVMDVGEYERREERRQFLAGLVRDLGARDPLAFLFTTWPALRRLRAAGEEAVPVLEESLMHHMAPAARARIEALLEGARR